MAVERVLHRQQRDVGEGGRLGDVAVQGVGQHQADPARQQHRLLGRVAVDRCVDC